MSEPTTAQVVLRIEQALRHAVPEVLFAPPRVVRRIIRADLDIPPLFARVPHRESIAIRPERLLELADDVWSLPSTLPAMLLLVARPDPELLEAGEATLAVGYQRRVFHACIDRAVRQFLATQAGGGEDFAALVRGIGDTAFEEARTVLWQEGLLRDRNDPREALAEFMAVVLELQAFAPTQLPVWFPAVDDHAILADRFAGCVAAADLLGRLHDAVPAGGEPTVTHAPKPRTLPTPEGLTRRVATLLRRRAAAAARRGNDVRAALLAWRLRHLAADDIPTRDHADRNLRQCIDRLVQRLAAARGLGDTTPAETATLLDAVVDRAAGSAWSQPARLLYDLQKICVDTERESYRTQLLSWLVTFGRIPLIRPLTRQRLALVHRHAAAAIRRLPVLQLATPLARTATSLLGHVLQESETAVRDGLGPVVRRSLLDAGLRPAALVEEAAFDKLVDEILDGVAARGFESFGNVRDAVSRNEVKLPDLAGPTELLHGDPLLRADRGLAAALDGAYRAAPAYLLVMQRLSALAFGVPLGRAITLHLALPFGGAWILWKGLEHLIEPLTAYSFGTPWHIYSRTAVLITGSCLWLVMHLPAVRDVVVDALRATGVVLHLVCIDLPRRLLRLPLVEAALRSRPVRLFRRYAWSPLVLTTIVWAALPHGDTTVSRGNLWLPPLLFAIHAALLNSPPGRLLQERILEAIGRVLQQLHARLVIGLLAWIVDVFRQAVDLVEGALYAVDEQLRFRTDESRLALAVKAVLTTLWSAVDWVVRFCVTLLIEPQLNPIKHFPVVTVSHKLLVPMIPMVAGNLAAATGMQRQLALTTVTFVSATIPGVFGFLAWELKENWRLYAANRPRLLTPAQVGRHGETMRRLLLPGFHSGTIPRLFARLRRRDATVPMPGLAPGRAREELVELAHDIAALVDDECLGLLRRTRLLEDLRIRVADVRLATNRVAIDLAADALEGGPLRAEFVQGGGAVSSHVVAPGWLRNLPADRQRLVRLGLAGLDCLCGVDFVLRDTDGGTESIPVEPIEWDTWRRAWERERPADDSAANRHDAPAA